MGVTKNISLLLNTRKHPSRLGYVPVLYANHPFDLAFRANDVAALNVAWQFFVNGLDYSLLARKQPN